MENLRVSIVQNDLVWENIPANLASFDELLKDIHETTDIIILPEMFTTGFSNNAKNLAVTMDSEPVQWMQRNANSKNAMLCGSMIIVENEQYFNRLICSFPDGTLAHYDKRHLFSLMHENENYSAGNSKLIIEFRGWKITPLICYDLRFPVWCRNTEMADLMIFVANWPEKRNYHWTTLLKARAIENQCYLAGVNRIGLDNKGNSHRGESAVYDFWGKEIILAENLRCTRTVTLSKTKLEEHRARFAFWKDSDTFNIEI
jgi:predicted amidohydrolase